MTDEPLKKAREPFAIWIYVALAVVVLDQLTKWAVVRFVPLYERIAVMPFLNITHQRNEGAAFSFLANASGWQRWFFIALALVVSVVLMLWLRRIRADQTVLAIGLSLVLGGALGNVIDRVMHGYVVDFIYFNWRTWDFPAFNIADTAISIGAGCLLLDAFLERGHGREAAPGERRAGTE